jgi:membrane protease YdiL (CAAX protease family)
MKKSSKKCLSIVLFYLIALSSRYYICIIKPDFYTNSCLFIGAILEGAGPLLGVLIVVYLFKRPVGVSLFGSSVKQSLVLFAIPVVLLTLTELLWSGNTLYTAYFSVVILLYGCYEEYGWRGYLQTELNGLNKIVRILVISVLWYTWHLNFAFTVNNLLFFLFLIFGSWGIGMIADKTKSLLACACFHSIVNIINTKGATPVYVQFIVVGICFAIWMLLIYKRKPAATLITT